MLGFVASARLVTCVSKQRRTRYEQQLECQLLRFIGVLGKYNFPVQLGIP